MATSRKELPESASASPPRGQGNPPGDVHVIASGLAAANIYSRTNIAAAVIMVTSILWLATWFYQRAGHIYVSDARIASTMVAVSSRTTGWIDEFPVNEGDFIEKGTLLARIDDREIRLQLQELTAKLATIQSEYNRVQAQLNLVAEQLETRIEARRSQSSAAKSALSEAELFLAQSENDWQRARSLLDEDIISREVWEARRSDFERSREKRNRISAESDMAVAALHEAEAGRHELQVLASQLDMITSRRNELLSHREQVELVLEDHQVRSSIRGYVDETFVNRGEYVTRGQRILIMHDPADIWVKANIKETDIRHIQSGASAKILVDAYPEKTFTGEIISVGNAATSQFALLPSPNPSGNFTKITQRVEVHVEIQQIDDLLKPGMMVELEIDAL